jgi:crossover junction endodeoxyribonuclease RuvC
MSIFLGVDPGLATIGFGVVSLQKGKLVYQDHGVIRTPATLPLEERLSVIRHDFMELLDELDPSASAVEELFFAKNVTNAMMVAQARGILVQCLHERGIPVHHFTPMQVKNNLAGYGKASKWQVQEMTRRLLSLSSLPRPDDAADALALAILAGRMSGH